MSFKHCKVGDTVWRRFGYDGPIFKGTVMAIKGELLYVAMEGTERWPLEGLWTFDRKTGAEEDPDLEWGVAFGITGTFLVSQ